LTVAIAASSAHEHVSFLAAAIKKQYQLSNTKLPDYNKGLLLLWSIMEAREGKLPGHYLDVHFPFDPTHVKADMEVLYRLLDMTDVAAGHGAVCDTVNTTRHKLRSLHQKNNDSSSGSGDEQQWALNVMAVYGHTNVSLQLTVGVMDGSVVHSMETCHAPLSAHIIQALKLTAAEAAAIRLGQSSSDEHNAQFVMIQFVRDTAVPVRRQFQLLWDFMGMPRPE